MSLELAIQQNTGAILALTAAIAAQNKPAAAEVEKPKKPKAEKPVEAPVVVVTEAVRAEEPVSVTEALAETSERTTTVASPMPTLADLQAEGKKLLDAGKQAELKSIVLANGGTKLSVLPESGYRATLKALKAAVAAI